MEAVASAVSGPDRGKMVVGSVYSSVQARRIFTSRIWVPLGRLRWWIWPWKWRRSGGPSGRLVLVRHGLLAFTSQCPPEPYPPRRRPRPSLRFKGMIQRAAERELLPYALICAIFSARMTSPRVAKLGAGLVTAHSATTDRSQFSLAKTGRSNSCHKICAGDVQPLTFFREAG